ncbi:MAG: hypothetical protein ACK56F_32265, partial [bacterium]
MLVREHPTDVLSMVDPRRENETRSSIGGGFDDFAASGPDQFVLIHGCLRLVGDKFPATHTDLTQISLESPCATDQGTQEPIPDQFSDS